MSRQLPSRPDLAHLRKQAKALLPDLRQRDADAQLSDALHAVAREYGFATWPALKAHVASLGPSAHPFAGVWIANVARSQLHDANPFQRATIEITVDGDRFTVTDDVVDAAGRSERRTNTIITDGREHASPGGKGYAVRSAWQNARVLETVATKDGEVVGDGRYEVSPDGETLTISAPGQVIVLERRIDGGSST